MHTNLHTTLQNASYINYPQGFNSPHLHQNKNGLTLGFYPCGGRFSLFLCAFFAHFFAFLQRSEQGRKNKCTRICTRKK